MNLVYQYAAMKKTLLFVSLAIITVSCQKEAVSPVEPSVYEACQQGFSETVTVTKSSCTGSDAIVTYKSMDEQFKFPTIVDELKTGKPIGSYYGYRMDGLISSDDVDESYFGEKYDRMESGFNIPDESEPSAEYILNVGENGNATFTSKYMETEYHITRNGNQIRLSPTTKDPIVRFSSKLISSSLSAFDESLVITNRDKDYAKYSTIQGEIEGETVILYFYDAQITRGSSFVSSSDMNYLDIDRIREEMGQDEVLEFVKKAICFNRVNAK